MKKKKNGFLNIFDKGRMLDPWSESFVPMTKEVLSPEVEKKIKSELLLIPPLPNILNQLLVIMNDVNKSSKKIAEFVSKDPVLAGKILQLVNSSFFGVKREVKSINTAITLLGINNVKNFVLQNSFSNIFKNLDEKIFPLEEFWVHSLASSVCAYHISSEIEGFIQEDISTIALLHDLGKLAFAVLEPDKYSEYKQSAYKNPYVPDILIEEETFGINHALLGSLLLSSWNLPDEICDTIMYHHSPPYLKPDQIPQEFRKEVVVVHFADMISKMFDQSVQDSEIAVISEDYFTLIGKKPPLELLLDNDIAQEILHVKVFIK